MEGDAFLIGDFARIFVVRDDGGDFGIKPADLDLIKQMQHRVIEFGDHDDDLGTAGQIIDLELHIEAVNRRVQHQFDFGLADIFRCAGGDAQKELVGLTVPELVGFNDIGPARCQGRGDGCDNARLVVTGDTQGIGMFAHWSAPFQRGVWRVRADASVREECRTDHPQCHNPRPERSVHLRRY